MSELLESKKVSFVLLTSVVITSGCLQTSSTNLNEDFDLEYVDVSVNSSGDQIFSKTMSKNLSNYSVNADNRMVLNLPVIGVSVNMTNEGVFEDENYEVNSSGIMNIKLAGNSNSTEFSTTVESSGKGAEVQKEIMEKQRQSVKNYSREDLGISYEALKDISTEDASVLGVSNLSGEENILLNLEVNNSDLLRNSEQIFRVHSVIQESTDSDKGMNSAGSFDNVKAYLWTGREDRKPSKFAYYGSAGNGTVQARSVINFK